MPRGRIMRAWLVGLALIGSLWVAEAHSQDYRPEIIRKVIDPCLLEVAVRTGFAATLGGEETKELMKAMYAEHLAGFIIQVEQDLFAKGLHRKSYRQRLAQYKHYTAACVEVFLNSYQSE